MYTHTHVFFHRGHFLEISLATEFELEARGDLELHKIYDMRLSVQNPKSLKGSALLCDTHSIEQTSKH